MKLPVLTHSSAKLKNEQIVTHHGFLDGLQGGYGGYIELQGGEGGLLAHGG